MGADHRYSQWSRAKHPALIEAAKHDEIRTTPLWGETRRERQDLSRRQEYARKEAMDNVLQANDAIERWLADRSRRLDDAESLMRALNAAVSSLDDIPIPSADVLARAWRIRERFLEQKVAEKLGAEGSSTS